MLNNEQARFDIFDHKTKTGNGSRRSPNSQLIAVIPDTEMNLGTLDCGREFRQNAGRQGQRMLKDHRLSGRFRWQIRERDLWKATFFRTKAGPESRVDDCRDRTCIRLRRQIVFTKPPRLREIADKVRLDDRRYRVRGLISWLSAHDLICR